MEAAPPSLWTAIAGYFMGEFPTGVVFGTVMLIPFAVLERLRPVGRAPALRLYALNVLIAAITAAIAGPVGILADVAAGHLRHLLSWKPVEFALPDGGTSFLHSALPLAGTVVIAVILHETWFYWAHRLEHAAPILWRFHRLHHSDENMNASTFQRDHVAQQIYRSFFAILTLGLVFDLDLKQAGTASLAYALFTTLWSMFYHSATRVRLGWLDRILVTPQVHRLHHSSNPAHFNRNFADNLPIFDIVFGTYEAPKPGDFPPTGLSDWTPRNPWAAQALPIVEAARLLQRRTDRRERSAR
jgi:sterol desaturase/sphingolipid hydroxylase (fatty acid hydroxylase superfamily)